MSDCAGKQTVGLGVRLPSGMKRARARHRPECSSANNCDDDEDDEEDEEQEDDEEERRWSCMTFVALPNTS